VAASAVVSVRVPSWAKKVLDEHGVEYRETLRRVLVALAEAARGDARRRLLEAFSLADSAAGSAEMSPEEIVRAVRGCED